MAALPTKYLLDLRTIGSKEISGSNDWMKGPGKIHRARLLLTVQKVLNFAFSIGQSVVNRLAGQPDCLKLPIQYILDRTIAFAGGRILGDGGSACIL